MIFFVQFLIPLLPALFLFILFHHRITLKEFSIQVGVQAVIAGIFVGLIYMQNVSDYEVWNGVVASKKQERVSCSHSYQCNCRSVTHGSGDNQTTSIECDTCYEHTHDYDWAVYTTNQERLEIDRVDRQGVNEPQRFAAVKMGEPTSVTHGFTNYIKGAPDTLFRHHGLVEKFQNSIPGYPGSIYDYYRLDRLVQVGTSVPDARDWNVQLSIMNGELGRKKQVNMIVVTVKNQPQDYFFALEQKWLGGKKNDAILVVNVDNENKITWAGVTAWTKNELFKVALRDDVLAVDTLDREKVLSVLKKNVQDLYVRKDFEEFSYLKASIKPSKWQWILSLVVGFLVSIGLSFALYKNEERDWKNPRNRSRY